MSSLRPFLALSVLGLLGVLALVPTLDAAIEQIRYLPDAPPVSDAALTAILLIQPAILLLAAVAIGVALAERAGLVSILLRRCRGKAAPEAAGGWLSGLLLAIGAGTIAAAADLILRTLSPGSFASIPRLDDVSLAGRATALLYGGITEELMIRFGLMTLLVWLGMRALRGRRPLWLVWTAIALAALAFAAGHLPALLSLGQPDTLLVLRTLALNAGLGLVYGWLYASRSLEHAMLAHMATHAVFWTATPLLSALGL
ncbi:CPBP family glutamic-type intramembrane protease [Microvirga subterranea]|uniref:CAAX prenyl protease-like protein n=1 Tax=Microvirga subterranea TaxID=186651 RepID=A0A370HVB3_9HYPH|nr:CPBP family glutamic-type intramembrane protease [Microvirga subterranea]RDI62437.1 CAAX prenyl protease-like protein [Microvirga subterranea]